MKRLMMLIVGAAIAGAVAALVAIAISRLTSGTVSPLAGGVIGIAFGITVGNLSGGPRSAGRRRSVGTALLQGAVAGATAAGTILLFQIR